MLASQDILVNEIDSISNEYKKQIDDSRKQLISEIMLSSETPD